MRDYLKLDEISDLISELLSEEEFSLFETKMEEMANTCLCSAYESSECCCGAWDDESELELNHEIN